MSSTVKEIIKNTINANNMIVTNDKIVVGVSGGADSMCLLHFLASIKHEYNLDIIVAHINHNLRGEEALRDQHLVESYCKKISIPCKVLSANINSISSQTGEGCEECGRRIRYEFFNKLCGENGKIATAHTLSDTCETILFNLARGTGLKGLCGIPKIRGNIIRPIIDITREQVEEYCMGNNIEYVIDSTNLENEYNRNKIRNIAIPVFKEINTNFENSVLRLTNIISQQLFTVNKLSDELLNKAKVNNGYNCTILAKSDNIILKQAVINLLKDIGCNSYEERHIELIIDSIINKFGVVQLPKGYTTNTKQGVLRVYKNSKTTDTPKENVSNLQLKKSIPSSCKEKIFIINNQKIKVKIMLKQEFDEIVSVHKLLVKNALDYDIIPVKSLLRSREPKDSFNQRSRGVKKSIKKLFNEAKIPQEQRDSIVMLADKSTVLWLQGFGVSQECAVTKNTKTVLLILSDYN